MNKHLIRLLVAIALVAYAVVAVSTVAKANHKVQIKEIKLKDTNAQLKELQLKYNTLNGSLDEQLKAKEADKAKIDELEKKRQELEQQLSVKKAQQASNQAIAAVTGTKVAYASSGDHNALMQAAGIPSGQWASAEKLVQRESSWNPNAMNSIGACSLVQALPCSKIPGDWRNPVDALRWGNGYVVSRYGSWDAALQHSYSHNWY